MKVYKVQVERTAGKSKGLIEFLVVRQTVNGKITVPRGYKLVAVISEI